MQQSWPVVPSLQDVHVNFTRHCNLPPLTAFAHHQAACVDQQFNNEVSTASYPSRESHHHRPAFCHIALWVKLCWNVVIGGFTKMIPTGPIFLNLNYFRQNIWRFSSVQFHFWHIFGTSWTQPTAAEGFTIESVTIQVGCRKDVNEVLRTSWM